MRYLCIITDHDPKWGGKVERAFLTRKEATWYGENEVEAARQIMVHPCTFEVRPVQ